MPQGMDGGVRDGIMIELEAEIKRLEAENKQLVLDKNKLSREVRSQELKMRRNADIARSKDNLSRVMNQRRSQLEKYMNLLLDSCPDIILLLDENGRIVYATRSFTRLVSLSTFGMIENKGHKEVLVDFLPGELLEIWGRIISGALENRKTTETTAQIDFAKNGKARNYSIQITPMVGSDGQVEGCMALFYDNTEIVEAQYEAERASNVKSDFLATVSHEIRTPMNAIMGVASMLRSTGLDDEQLKLLDTIQSSSQVLLNLINDVLDFSKIESGKLQIVNAQFDLHSRLEDIKAMFELLFSEKGVEFICDFAETIPKAVIGDGGRLGQVLSNVVSNALKYTLQGRVTFRVYPADENDIIVFEVEDTGIGIKPEYIERLFIPFEQFHLVSHKNISGSGLGLPITKNLCEMMNGRITVESEYGKGSIFSLLIPLKPGDSPELLDAEFCKELTGFTAPGVRALIVDDIAINLQIAEFMLEPFGIECDLANSGLEAIEKSSANQYDLIFMDHMMPEMDGIETANRIRTLGFWQVCVPIIALTANAVGEARELFAHNGFGGVLAKPMIERELAACLLKHLPSDKIKRD